MKVRVYDTTDNPEVMKFRCECDLTECYPDKDGSYAVALENLKEHGHHYEGGGAAPLVYLSAKSTA